MQSVQHNLGARQAGRPLLTCRLLAGQVGQEGEDRHIIHLAACSRVSAAAHHTHVCGYVRALAGWPRRVPQLLAACRQAGTQP